MKIKLILFSIFILSFFVFYGCEDILINNEADNAQNTSLSNFTDINVFEKAFLNHQSGIQVMQKAEIVRILTDDSKGSRHQRFIVKLTSGHTLLVAHNIDIAKRVLGLEKGRLIIFYGEYEWNNKGGVIHWTHHDPKGAHEDGWIEYKGKRYG
jgi:hypothetical protein